MPQQEHNPISGTKLAYVAGIADTLEGLGLVKFASAESAEAILHHVSSKLAFEPADENTPPTLEKTAQVAEAVIKLAADVQESCDSQSEEDKKKESDKKREEIVSKMEDKEEKEAAERYFRLCDSAVFKAQKLASALSGENPGSGTISNDLPTAAMTDSIAAIDNAHRPPGYAENPPDRAPNAAADAGQQMPNPNAASVGKTASQLILERIGVVKTAAPGAGENPGMDANGNSLPTAAMTDSIAAIDNEHRPAGYAENPPERAHNAAADGGQQSPNPNASDVGKTAAETQAKEAAAMATGNPAFQKLSKEEKLAHIRAMMPLNITQKVAYLSELQNMSSK